MEEVFSRERTKDNFTLPKKGIRSPYAILGIGKYYPNGLSLTPKDPFGKISSQPTESFLISMEGGKTK